VYDQIMLYEPDVAPLITLLNRVKNRRPVKQTKYEWFEDDYVAQWTTAAATAGNHTTDTTLTVTDGTLFVAGDMFCHPRAVTSYVAPEICRVTVVSGNVLTLIRDVGSAGVDTITSGDALRLLGSAHEENGAIPSPKGTSKLPKYTYLQIEKTATSFSNTAIAVATYGTKGSDRDNEHIKAMVEQKRKLNSTLLWGRSSQDLTGGPNSNPIRTTMGLRQAISTNITDVGGILTRKKFEEFSRTSFRYGKKEKILLACPLLVSAINEWATNFLMVKPAEDHYGVSISEVQTGHGTFAMVKDWMLEDGVASKNGFAGVSFAVDLDEIEYLYLKNNGLNRDTHIELNAVQDGTDGKKDQIVTEYGFKISREKFHSMLYDMTDYMQ